MRFGFIFLLFFIMSVAMEAQTKYDFVVAQDGTGDFKTIQEAINAVPDMRANRTHIFIKAGLYKEKLVLAPSKTNVSFVGEDVQRTIITYDDFAAKKNRFGEEIGTFGSPSFFINGDGFTAENITFENSSGPVGQAVAVCVNGDKVSFRNCRFLGCQDTLYFNSKTGRSYFVNCYMDGTVDFIFGFSTAFFEKCTIFCKKGGYITAAATPQGKSYGFVFHHCKITGSAPDGSFYLGRPWRPYAKVAFLNCELDPVIKCCGWNNWGKATNEQTALYTEYKNTGTGACNTGRVEWAKQLSDAEAESYQTDKVLNGWNPESGQWTYLDLF
jgi:pectinesterase